MNELQAILEAVANGGANASDAVLATVVHVEGSAYRRPGARMLLMPGGNRIGSISGGCLENDVARKAWWYTENGQASVQIYDTSSDDDAIWEFGLGCNGVIHVLMERVDAPEPTAALAFLRKVVKSRTEAVITTVIAAQAGSGVAVGDRFWIDCDGESGGKLATSAIRKELRRLAGSAFRSRNSCLAHLPAQSLFVEWIGPPVPLVLFGAGQDALPLVALAKQVGWHVTVVDGMGSPASIRRFAAADRVEIDTLSDPLGSVRISPATVVVLMTHNFARDEELLTRILPHKPRYLGVLGARSRTERLLNGLSEAGSYANAYAPVGLDIGAETPEAIAISIVAEIHAVLAGRNGASLRTRPSPIHEPVLEVGEPIFDPAAFRHPAVCESG